MVKIPSNLQDFFSLWTRGQWLYILKYGQGSIYLVCDSLHQDISICETIISLNHDTILKYQCCWWIWTLNSSAFIHISIASYIIVLTIWHCDLLFWPYVYFQKQTLNLTIFKLFMTIPFITTKSFVIVALTLIFDLIMNKLILVIW